jgi:hypothetical protein
MSNPSDARLQNKLFGRYNEFILLLVAFLLTTIVGGYLTNNYQTCAYQKLNPAGKSLEVCGFES